MFRERTWYASFTFGCFLCTGWTGKSHRLATANREEHSRNAHTGACPTRDNAVPILRSRRVAELPLYAQLRH